MTPQERLHLHARLRVRLLGTAAWAALALLLVWLPWRSATAEGFLDRGQLYLLVPLGLVWLWLLRKAPGQSRRILSDLRQDRVAECSGEVSVRPHRGVGLIAPEMRRLRLDGIEFDASGFDLDDLAPGSTVSVRYAPASRVLLTLQQTARTGSATTSRLSERDRTLLRLIAEGLPDKLIARRLQLSPTSVRTYNSALFRKLGVASRREAVAQARRTGLLDVD